MKDLLWRIGERCVDATAYVAFIMAGIGLLLGQADLMRYSLSYLVGYLVFQDGLFPTKREAWAWALAILFVLDVALP